MSRAFRHAGADAVPLHARALAPAKINLGLFVGPRRAADGRHELVSVMQSISLADELTLESIESGFEEGRDEIRCPGVPGDPSENLAARALRVYREATGWNPGPLRLTIDKRIPVAAGLGGGSADAAATLRLAHHLAGGSREPKDSRVVDQDRSRSPFRPPLRPSSPQPQPQPPPRPSFQPPPDELLLGLAAELGADVPAQLVPGRWLATGGGEQLRALPAPVRSFGVLVLPVPVALSTADVYRRMDELGVGHSSEALMDIAAELERELAGGAELPAARELLLNELQTPAMALCPQIAPTLRLARDTGAEVALVSGSGPTVLALFTGAAEDADAAEDEVSHDGSMRGGGRERGDGAERGNDARRDDGPEPGDDSERGDGIDCANGIEHANGPERARAAAERLTGRTPAAVWAVPVDAAFARAVDVPVRHNHDR